MHILLLLATLSGRVVDLTNAPLPGVTVEAAKRVAVTERDGTYELALEDGTYDVTFQLINFATVTRRGVAVEGATTLDATLNLAASADVVVTAKDTFHNDLIGTADSATAGVVTADEIARRPAQRAGNVLETVPGVVVSQHSGEGKANQYYLRGFNLDHGTDIAITVASVPVNMPTHAHGQGYADANFLIPELIAGMQYRKGPYFADAGDFASAGAVDVSYLNLLERPIVFAQAGSFGFGRALIAASPRLGDGFLLVALEATRNQGPWLNPDDYRRLNAVLRYSAGGQHGGFNITAMGYDARWSSTDQIPLRAVRSLGRFGAVDDTDGGVTSRYSLSAEWQRGGAGRLTQVSAYAMKYRLNLFSNFTYFLDDPVNGDQFEQADDRFVSGLSASHRWIAGRTENLFGIQARRDDIGEVALYHTVAQRRIGTIREDSILQTSTAAYAQSTVHWNGWLRTTLGLRGDRGESSLVSPKLAVTFGPWRNAELYLNAGGGFHSNDARAYSPLVRTRGAEIGVRTKHVTAAVWGLAIDSELLFVGDAGTTEAGRPSRRTGVEITGAYSLRPWLALDAQYAYSKARYRNGDRIPGAVEGVASAGLSVIDRNRFSGELRYRFFGARPLVEDDSVRSRPSSLVNARVGYALTPHVRLDVDVFNVLDARVSDVDYFYTSRLRGEAAPVDDVHFHPVERRSVRVGVSTTF